ncbi:MAG: DNA polymerase I [Clostridia bacterium]|nr:DNA polymerase I [Clostridia bacterium]
MRKNIAVRASGRADASGEVCTKNTLQEKNMKKLLAVDGNSILNRAFYGVRALTTAQGLPTNAVYGVINIINKHFEDIRPDYFAVAFDLRAPTFRHKAFDAYKANRHGMPEELAVQRPYAYDCLAAFGAHCLEKEGFEADDILGTLAAMGEAEGDTEVYILTGDRDALQLISPKTRIILATNTEPLLFDEAAFKEKYGVAPAQFVDVKALMGDSSDNIPGVKGIGEKTALGLISEYGSLDEIYNDTENKNIAKAAKAKLLAGKEMAYISQFLATIKRDVDLGMDIEALRYTGADKPRLRELFTELEFTKFIKKFALDADEGAEETAASEEKAEFTFSEKGVAALEKGEKYALCFDLEAGKAYFCRGNEVFADTLENILPYLSDKSYAFIVHDAKAAYHALAPYGTDFAACLEDVMLMGYVCSASENDFSLEKLCSRALGASPASGEERAYCIYALYLEFCAELEKSGQCGLYGKIEFPLARVLYNMEKEGFFVDTAKLSEFSAKLGEMIDVSCEKIYGLAGERFNINSPKQLGHILFEVLCLPPVKKTKSGYSTDAEVMEKLRPYHPIVGEILEYRKVAKLKSTYAEGLLAAADERGRVHTSFKQALTATGRLSSTEPNLQNIPIKTELGREMRKFFAAEKEGYVLIDADYSQIELRLLAAISGDDGMISAFGSGADIHTSTAMKVFGVGADEVTVEMRKKAKAINFGIMYGMGAYSLSGDLNTTVAAAKAYIEDYMHAFPMVEKYLSDIVEQAKKDGFVTTLLGRRRYIPELSSKRKMEVAFGERVAMNSPIQGSAADIIKLAMVNVEAVLREGGYDARLIMQVHDELIIEAHESCAEEVKALLVREMERALTLPVKLAAEVGVGKTWFDAH